MKRYLFLFLLMAVLTAVLPCAGQISKVDPILLTTPNPRVFECTEELVLELLVEPRIEYTLGGRDAKNYFLYLTVEFLYLQDFPWNGLDKNSFHLKHVDSAGQEQLIPLDYMMTAMMSMKNGWRTMADQLDFPSLLKFVLVFDVETMDREGWSLVFQPAQRGSEPSCTTEIPLQYRWWSN